MTEPLWIPSAERIAGSGLTKYVDWLQAADNPAHADYAALHQWSTRHRGAFWRSIWQFADVIGEPGSRDTTVPEDRLPETRFFPDARLNFAENLIERGRDSDLAMIVTGEGVPDRDMTRAELRMRVDAVAGWLQAQGVVAGDRVAAVMPNLPETVIAALAAAKIGAVWSSCSPDFGMQGILDRFEQIRPTVLFAVDGYRYGGKLFDVRDKLEAVRAALTTLKRVVMVSYLGESPPSGWLAWDALESDGCAYQPLPFDHPLYILFSSGTTGQPKCIVHGAGGTLLQHLKEHQLHSDIAPGDRVLYFTTCGWMMWNWLVSVLASSATVVLYEGSPASPQTDVLFDIAQRHRVSLLGVSAGWINAVRKSGIRPADRYDLSALKTICSTGSPLSPEGFAYVYEAIKQDVQLASISGGTDIVSCFVLGNPTAAVYQGQIQCAGLGMDVDVADESGASCPPGHKGELVCRSPFPSMPVAFWNDPDGTRYRAAYFERFAGIWHHGDFAETTPEGGYIIHGRSDATLNPGGVRIGTAELYRVLERMPKIAEAAAIGADVDGEVRIVLFVVLSQGALNDALAQDIRRRLRSEASPRHVPRDIFAVSSIPKTRTGKTAELALKTWIEGGVVRNRNALVGAELFDTRPPALSR
ncbi:MAG: acetoacetate--CoA ligase [Abyssibacter sp.]|uniref:acetoacetate--CoA ligase n=1 Tax=Abyssibacter sp. TaxID=2320200 RepID=UPI00321BACC5